MAELSASPSPAKLSLPRNLSSSSLRVPGYKGFPPLASEPNAFSTRGQTLPSLLSRRSSILRRGSRSDDEDDLESFRLGLADRDAERRNNSGALVLKTPQMRSQLLIGNSNPRYRWERYYKSDEELKKMKKPIREYYERNNYLIHHYMYIDRLLDSSLPHNLIQEYSTLESGSVRIPSTISEETASPNATPSMSIPHGYGIDTPSLSAISRDTNSHQAVKVKRTPKNLYKLPEDDERTPLIGHEDEDPQSLSSTMPEWVPEEDEDTDSPIVRIALYINLAANTVLLILKIIVAIMTSSLSVIASLVDAALDFLSTAIVGITSWMIARQDQYAYPVGRRRLEPIGVLVSLSVLLNQTLC